MIKNIVFDVGDILLSYRWQDMLTEHGLDKALVEKIGAEVFLDPMWSKFDAGYFTQEEIIQGYGFKYPEHANEIKWFIEHKEQMPVPRKEIWDMIPKLKEKGYKIFLLSNYSKEFFEAHTKNAGFMQEIDGRVVSYEVRKLKPDTAIYQILCDKYELHPEECIFFDDRIENVEAAIAFGMQSVNTIGIEALKKELEKLL